MNSINEDIEIVEELVEHNYLEDLGYLRDNNDYIRFNQALENLIKGYRELEKHIAFYEKHGSYKKRIIELKEENEELKEQVEYLKHEVVLHGSTVEKLVREKMNSIPKSKIKEKIEELNNYDSEFCQRVINHSEHTLTEFVQNILQELMEDK